MELIVICAACGRLVDFTCIKNVITVDVCPCKDREAEEDEIIERSNLAYQDDRDYPLKYC